MASFSWGMANRGQAYKCTNALANRWQGEEANAVFVITIGPLKKSWIRILKLALVLLAVILLLFFLWRYVGPLLGGRESRIPVAPGAALGLEGTSVSFWQDWLTSVRLWLKLGF